MIYPVKNHGRCEDGRGPLPATNANAVRLLDSLTADQYSILIALSVGKTNKEIVRSVGFSEQAVKSHLRNIYGRLGVRNRVEAARIVWQSGVR